MARRLAKISPEAARWLKREITYLAERSPQAAARVALNIREARERLMELPRAARRGVIPGTERLFVKPEYILTVRVREGVVEIAAIRSARQADPYAPPKLLDASDDPDAEGGSGGEPREPREPA